jgi:molybdopterin/thiamine biosynthesis adenylyltransferase
MCLHYPLREIQTPPDAALAWVRGLDRAARRPKLVDVEDGALTVLRTLDLGFVGTGSVGLHMVDLAARNGVRGIRVVDPASLKLESLLTHPCAPGDLGRSKASVAAERAKALSPATRVFAFEGPFEALPANSLAGVQFLMLASDNLSCEANVAQYALHLGIPVIQASVYGPTLTAQVRSFAAASAGAGVCICCGFGRSEWEDLDRGTIYSCSGGGPASGAAAEPSRIPTVSLPHLCALAANLALMELFRRALGLGDPAESRLVEYNGYTHRTTLTKLTRRDDCPLDHEPLRVTPRRGDLGQSTPRALLREAGYLEADPRRTTLAVEGRQFASLAVCDCDAHPRLGRFLAVGAAAGKCAGCGQERVPHPLHSHSEVPVAELAGLLDRTLAQLGAPEPASVRVRGESGAALFYRSFPDAGGLGGAE